MRAALMLALYRSGRQAEALAVFRSARAEFREELGIEPGDALCRLHTAILAQDDALDDLVCAPELSDRMPSGAMSRSRVTSA